MVTAAWWLWSEHESAQEQTGGTPGPEPFVRLAGAGVDRADVVLRERAEFFDPAPLFIPTSRNYGQGQLPARLVKQPGQVFTIFGSKLIFADGGLSSYGTENLAVTESVVEILGRANEAPFAGMGETGLVRKFVSDRSAFMQIKQLGDGELTYITLSGLLLPRADFAPLEFIVAVGPAGITGGPLLSLGSGRDEIDIFFRDYLAKTYRIGSVLAPGRYRITIGP
ncbi:MAG: hypothetical protein Q8J74_01485 [Candidatus Didemnitutus sp.]|nr:hypothetical protein [Candidatus Didemnitutus sp.]